MTEGVELMSRTVGLDEGVAPCSEGAKLAPETQSSQFFAWFS